MRFRSISRPPTNCSTSGATTAFGECPPSHHLRQARGSESGRGDPASAGARPLRLRRSMNQPGGLSRDRCERSRLSSSIGSDGTHKTDPQSRGVSYGAQPQSTGARAADPGPDGAPESAPSPMNETASYRVRIGGHLGRGHPVRPCRTPGLAAPASRWVRPVARRAHGGATRTYPPLTHT